MCRYLDRIPWRWLLAAGAALALAAGAQGGVHYQPCEALLEDLP